MVVGILEPGVVVMGGAEQGAIIGVVEVLGLPVWHLGGLVGQLVIKLVVVVGGDKLVDLVALPQLLPSLVAVVATIHKCNASKGTLKGMCVIY